MIASHRIIGASPMIAMLATRATEFMYCGINRPVKLKAKAQDARDESRAPNQQADREQPQAPENLVSEDSVVM
jgi:hypothetical protein